MINNLYIKYKLLLRFSSYLSFISSFFTYQKQRKDANMTTSKSNGAYNTLISLRDKLTRLNGVITPEAVYKHEDELGGIFTVTKTHHEQGQKYGHLASTIPEAKYRLIIGNSAWAHDVPTDPGAYSQAA